MKKFYNYAFRVVFIYVVVLSVFTLFSFETTVNNYSKSIIDENKDKMLGSTLIAQNYIVKMEEEKARIEAEKARIAAEEAAAKAEEERKAAELAAAQAPKEIPNLNIIDTSGYPALAEEYITMSRYGHDCYGCGDGTAAGYYIGDGRRYYNDPEFGSLRIVAADKKYPLGTVIRLTNGGEPFAAIVLDRGGGIGDHAKFQIDLLESSEKVANQGNIGYNVRLEVLRYGY